MLTSQHRFHRVVSRLLGLPWLVIVLCVSFAATPLLRAQTTSDVEAVVTDQQGLPIAGAEVRIMNPALGIDRRAETGADGACRIAGLPAGTYTLATSKSGFVSETLRNLELTVNSTSTLKISLKVGAQTEKVEVSAEVPLLDSTSSATGSTITPQQINDMPINGRNYLDLLQLVPGVAINRQQDPTQDGATPILGERGGNAVFLIDGLPNRDEVNGGAAAQFNMDSILEFQVVTGSYKAEFGHGSGGVINVVSKSGTNDWHGGVSFFHRNYKLDSSDSDLVLKGTVPFLLRYDPSVQIGGPILKDKVFFFGSAERILETRQLNFEFPPATPPILITLETPYNLHTKTYDTRARAKLDEVFWHHRFSEQINLTNTHVTDYLPLLAAINLPSTRNDIASRRLMLGFTDVAMLGNQSNPFLLNLYLQYRGEPSVLAASHPQAGPALTLDNLFSSLNTGQLFGDGGQVEYGPGHTPLLLDQNYLSAGANLGKQLGRHGWKFGWDFQKTHVNGVEASNLFNQLFGTVADLGVFGPINSGVYFLNEQSGLTPQDNLIRLRNNYNGLFVQDDWKAFKNLTLNLGVRWDYDSQFPNITNFSPRLGFAWAINSKTVLRASWGLFYDHFRLGLARDVPGFGGANLSTQTFLSFPRLFYGNPSTITELFAGFGDPIPCASPNMTDAQIATAGLTCSVKNAAGVPEPLYGYDHLNSVVAPGHAPIPANAVVNKANVQALTGFTPAQFADAVGVAVGNKPGSGVFGYDPNGVLTISGAAFPTNGIPISVSPGFKTPYTNNFHVGFQRELSPNTVVQIDYYYKSIDNILGVRDTNLAFEARTPEHTLETVPAGSQLVFGYGPWLHGTYHALTFAFSKRMSKRFTLEANYTWTHEIDNALNSNFISDLQASGMGAGYTDLNGPTDSFVGMTTLVNTAVGTLPAGPPFFGAACGGTNANGPITACNGNPVPKAGIFYNGPNLDKGPSDLALNHTFLMHGLVQLPWKMDFSGIFRAQSGFHYTASFPANDPDVDGDNLFNGVNYLAGRNHFVAPPFVNMDVRLAKRFDFGERLRLHAYLEFFNLFNRANPAAINGLPPLTTTSTAPLFGQILQVLPGREGQAGIRFEF
jgi:outer membrane receptor protein involved in Fe transport